MSPKAKDDTPIPMKVAGVVMDPGTQSPVVLLRGVADPRVYLPIFIGNLEASAIATVLAGVKMPRPMTHDLLANILRELGWTVERIVVTALQEGTFYGEITLQSKRGRVVRIDARPSDSIALALRVEAGIFVVEAVLAEAGTIAEGDEDEEAGEPGTEAAEGDEERAPSEPLPIGDPDGVDLEDLDPDLFGKYKM